MTEMQRYDETDYAAVGKFILRYASAEGLLWMLGRALSVDVEILAKPGLQDVLSATKRHLAASRRVAEDVPGQLDAFLQLAGWRNQFLHSAFLHYVDEGGAVKKVRIKSKTGIFDPTDPGYNLDEVEAKTREANRLHNLLLGCLEAIGAVSMSEEAKAAGPSVSRRP